MPEISSAVWDDYSTERAQLQLRVDSNLRAAMAKLVGQPDHADLLLITSDGQRMSVHRAIVQQRAPGFYSRYIAQTVKEAAGKAGAANKQSAVVQVPLKDVDASTLKFFMTSIYTEDEVPASVTEARGSAPPPDDPPDDDSAPGSSGGPSGPKKSTTRPPAGNQRTPQRKPAGRGGGRGGSSTTGNRGGKKAAVVAAIIRQPDPPQDDNNDSSAPKDESPPADQPAPASPDTEEQPKTAADPNGKEEDDDEHLLVTSTQRDTEEAAEAEPLELEPAEAEAETEPQPSEPEAEVSAAGEEDGGGSPNDEESSHEPPVASPSSPQPEPEPPQPQEGVAVASGSDASPSVEQQPNESQQEQITPTTGVQQETSTADAGTAAAAGGETMQHSDTTPQAGQGTQAQAQAQPTLPCALIDDDGNFCSQVDDAALAAEIEAQLAEEAAKPPLMTSFRQLASQSPMVRSTCESETSAAEPEPPVVTKAEFCCQADAEVDLPQSPLEDQTQPTTADDDDSGNLSPDSFADDTQFVMSPVRPQLRDASVGTVDIQDMACQTEPPDMATSPEPDSQSTGLQTTSDALNSQQQSMTQEELLLLDQLQSVSEQTSVAQTPMSTVNNDSIQADFAKAAQKQLEEQAKASSPKFISFSDLPTYNKNYAEPSSLPAPDSRLMPYGDHLDPRKIFPIFIEFEPTRAVVRPMVSPQPAPTEPTMSTSFINEQTNGMNPGFKRRLSMASLRSLDSVDMSPSHEYGTAPPPPKPYALSLASGAHFPPDDQLPCSTLASDLMKMFTEQAGTDLVLQTKDGELGVHRAILSSRSAYFASVLGKQWRASNSHTYDMTSYNKASVHYTMCFIYGGLTTVPDGLNIWELMSMADLFKLEDMTAVLALHFKAKHCHYFHRPCAGCVPAALDSLPRLHSFGLKDELDLCLKWQAKYFSRIWKSRAFAQLNVNWQQKCFNSVVENMSTTTVINTLLGCEKLQITLPRVTKGGISTESVSGAIAQLLDHTIEFMAANFDTIITTEQFLNQGRGMALNLGLLEDVLPCVIHALSPDTGCRVLVRLYELLVFLNNVADNKSSRGGRASPSVHESTWNERFTQLIRRLYELCDTHLIHSASVVIKCDSWNLLNSAMQQRIKETGIFVEMRQPRAPPPRLSSLTRSYRRSASQGGGGSMPGNSSSSFVGNVNSNTWERGRSLTRRSPSSAIPESAAESAETPRATSTDELSAAVQEPAAPQLEPKQPEPKEPEAKPAPVVAKPPAVKQVAATKPQERPKTLATAPPKTEPTLTERPTLRKEETFIKPEKKSDGEKAGGAAIPQISTSPRKKIAKAPDLPPPSTGARPAAVPAAAKTKLPTQAVEPNNSLTEHKATSKAAEPANTSDNKVAGDPKQPAAAAATKKPAAASSSTTATAKPAPSSTTSTAPKPSPPKSSNATAAATSSATTSSKDKEPPYTVKQVASAARTPGSKTDTDVKQSTSRPDSAKSTASTKSATGRAAAAASSSAGGQSKPTAGTQKAGVAQSPKTTAAASPKPAQSPKVPVKKEPIATKTPSATTTARPPAQQKTAAAKSTPVAATKKQAPPTNKLAAAAKS